MADTAPRLAIAFAQGADRAVPLPVYATQGAAGADICANFGASGGGCTLAPGARALIPTGLRMAVPAGHEVQIRGRSGLALHHGIGLANGVGTIDADYRGPVGVILVNMGDTPFEVTHGMRIAQMVLAPALRAELGLVDDLPATARGAGGFGSTGLAAGGGAAPGAGPETAAPVGTATTARAALPGGSA